MLWNDRKGAFSPLKAATLALICLPGLWVAYKLATGTMGAKPIEAALHETGLWAIRLLLVTLALTPFRLISGLNRFVLLRRMIGVSALAYALIHISLYVYDQKFDLWRVASEVVLRFYLTIGFVALLALLALGLTSTGGAIRRMGATAWNRLHLLIYPLTVLAIFHGFLQAKIDVSEDVIMAGVFLALMGVRAMKKRIAMTPLTLLVLTVAAVVGAAGLETAWYALATGIPADRVFDANFMIALQPRPALVVGMIVLALSALALAMRIVPSGQTPGRVQSRRS